MSANPLDECVEDHSPPLLDSLDPPPPIPSELLEKVEKHRHDFNPNRYIIAQSDDGLSNRLQARLLAYFLYHHARLVFVWHLRHGHSYRSYSTSIVWFLSRRHDFVQQRFTGMILDGNNRGQDTTFRIPMSKRLLMFDYFTAGTNIFEDRESLSSYRNGSSSANPFSSSITIGNDPMTLQFILNLNDGVLENRITIYTDNYTTSSTVQCYVQAESTTLLSSIHYWRRNDWFLRHVFRNPRRASVTFPVCRERETKVLSAAELNRIFMTHKADKLEKIVHSVVGESIWFKPHYEETGDTFF